MTEGNAESTPNAKQFADMLAQPPLLPDPVFPPANYLAAFGMHFFQALVRNWQRPELIPQIAASGGTRQMVMLLAGGLGFWAFDFEEKSDRGVSGRDEFLDRVKEPIRRPPAHLAAFTVEQHLVARGVLRIQLGGGDSLPGQYEICQLKTLGWYVAQLVSPKS
jgi:hypothetical protein